MKTIRHNGAVLQIIVMHSYAGFFLGTCDEDGPHSRESQYFRTAADAQKALDAGDWVLHEEGLFLTKNAVKSVKAKAK